MVNGKINIAIDGPSGAGKSTMAKEIAEHFGLIYIDTGAIYRSVGLFAHESGVGLDDQQGVTEILDKIELLLIYDDNGAQRMLLNGRDVSDDIRMPEVSIYASLVSAMQPVRAFLLDMQREFARSCDVVMDGRDIGTVVLPDAAIKIFLTAEPKDRAARRYQELRDKGVETTYEQVYNDLIYRDESDKNRAAAPLKPAEDSVIVDTSGNSLEQSTKQLITLIEEKLLNAGLL